MEVLNGVKCILFGLSGAEYVLLKTFYVLSRSCQNYLKSIFTSSPGFPVGPGGPRGPMGPC